MLELSRVGCCVPQATVVRLAAIPRLVFIERLLCAHTIRGLGRHPLSWTLGNPVSAEHSLSRGWQNTASLCPVHEVRMGFTFFNGQRKIKEGEVFCDV